MDPKIKEYFDGVVTLAQATFERVEYVVDATPQRAILRLEAHYGDFRVFIVELFSDKMRKYRYYLLRGDWVEAGFDNSPDPRAIRLKYGKIRKKNVGENVPHLHLENKARLTLTHEMTFADFVEWLNTAFRKATPL